MRTTLSFIFLILLLATVNPFKGEASTSKLTTIEDKDPEGFFRMFREMPEGFTASKLKVFLNRTGNIYPIDVTYEKNGQPYKSIIYKRYFKSEGYYFTLLTRHNLMKEEFLNLENVLVKFNSASRSGLQTKLHYSIYLGNNDTPFSFRILYASELTKNMASTPFVQAYQKTRTNELAKKVARPDSGNWQDAIEKQAQVEQKRIEKAKKKSVPTKEFIAERYRQLAQETTASEGSMTNEASSSATPTESRPAMLRKFSARRLELPTASTSKTLNFKLSEQEKKEALESLEAQYTSSSQAGKPMVKRQSSKVLLAEQREQKKQFQTKRGEEGRVDSIVRRSSISSSVVPLLPTSPRMSPERVKPEIRQATLISSPRLKGKEELAPLAEYDEENHDDDISEVSQADIQELFEDFSGSE